MSNTTYTNFVNISALPVLQEVAPGDYFVVKTEQGESLVDYASLPFVTISASNVVFNGTISAANLNILNVISATSAFFDQIYVNGLSGLNQTGEANYLVINSGVITSAAVVPSTFYNRLSAEFDNQLDALSAAVPVIFYDGGIVNIDGGVNTPVYSEVIRGSNSLPNGIFVSTNDINVKYLWNNQLEDQLTNMAVTTGIADIPVIYIEESPSNNYVDSNSKVYFRAIFRPPLLAPARIAWNITKILN